VDRDVEYSARFTLKSEVVRASSAPHWGPDPGMRRSEDRVARKDPVGRNSEEGKEGPAPDISVYCMPL
jgi:hypothetical protein